jgi:dihydrofolate reductase
MTSGKTRPVIHLVAASTPQGVIGVDNELPWECPADMAHFRKLTTNGMVVMGRLTWESIPQQYRPLPNRYNIILSRKYDEDTYIEHQNRVQVVDDLNKLIEILPQAAPEIFIIGGAQIYRQCIRMGIVDYMHITYMGVDDIAAKHPGKQLVTVSEFQLAEEGVLLHNAKQWYYMGGRCLDPEHEYLPTTAIFKNKKSERRLIDG